MNPRILVTGATGTVGRELIAQLAAQGADVRAMSSRADAAGRPDAPALPWVHGDFRAPETLRRVFEGVDVLFLLLPLVPDKPALAQAAVDAARASGVRHLVRLSVLGADAGSTNAFARMQGEIDARVTESGLPWTLLRPNGFMQNYLTYAAGMIRSGRFFAAHGDAPQAMVDAADIGACAAAVLTRPQAHAGAVYHPTGARAWTQAEAMAEISRALGREVHYVPVDDAAARAGMAGMGVPETVIGWLESLNAMIRDGLGAAVTTDVQRLTGHAPRPFEDFVRAHAQSWQ